MRRFLLTLGALAIAHAARAGDADHDLLLKVKTAIAAEPGLRTINVTVSVADGVAVLGGQVPDTAATETLVKAVKAVPGVSAVRADCWVPPGEDPLQAALRAKLLPTSNPLKTATPLTSALYSPVPPPAPPAPAGPPEFPTIPSPRVPVTPGQDVATAVEAIRKSEARYDGLTLNVTAGRIAITGVVRDGADAWDLAAAIRRVPGVEKVIVGRTTIR